MPVIDYRGLVRTEVPTAVYHAGAVGYTEVFIPHKSGHLKIYIFP